jgi:hypothetical protein
MSTVRHYLTALVRQVKIQFASLIIAPSTAPLVTIVSDL